MNQYKITQRVTDLAKRYGGPVIANHVKDYYGRRSKYLHQGVMLASSSYRGKSIPQLDPTDPSGCRIQVAWPSGNLREYVGYCMRKVLKAIVRGEPVTPPPGGEDTPAGG